MRNKQSKWTLGQIISQIDPLLGSLDNEVADLYALPHLLFFGRSIHLGQIRLDLTSVPHPNRLRFFDLCLNRGGLSCLSLSLRWSSFRVVTVVYLTDLRLVPDVDSTMHLETGDDVAHGAVLDAMLLSYLVEVQAVHNMVVNHIDALLVADVLVVLMVPVLGRVPPGLNVQLVICNNLSENWLFI